MFLLGSGWFGIWYARWEGGLSALRTKFASRSIAAAFAKNPPSFILFLGLQGIGSGKPTSSQSMLCAVLISRNSGEYPSRLCKYYSHSVVLSNVLSGVSIISSYFPPGKWKNAAFAILGSGQPIGFIIGMIIGERFQFWYAYDSPTFY